MSTAPSDSPVQPTSPVQPGKVYRLRPSVHFAPLEQGVFFKSWSRSFSFKGHASLYPLFERLLPHLEKGVRVGELLAAVPENVRRVISSLLEQLASHDMLLDVEALSQPPPSGPEAEHFASTLSYLESVAADPHAAFSQLRRARVLVGGAGPALFACVRSLSTMGVGHLACAAEEAEPVAGLLKQSPLTTHELLPLAQLVERARGGSWDVVLSLPRAVEPDSVARLEEGTTAPLLQVALGESLGVLGPMGHREGCGLRAALARLRVPLAEARNASPVLAAFLGNLAAFEAFKHLAGVASPTQERQCAVVRQESLASSFHPVEPLPAPAELDASALRQALSSFQQLREPVERKALLQALQPLADELFGLIIAPHPGDLPQMPLFVSASPPQPATQAALGFSRSAEESSERALLAALCRKAESTAEEVLPVLELRTGELMRVPRKPWLSMVAGDTYAGWLEEGLRECLLRHISQESDLGLEVKATPVALDKGLSGEVALSWKTLRLRQGRRVAVHHLTLPAVPGFHAVAVLEEGTPLGLAAALDFGKALEAALLEAIARVQLETHAPRLPERPSLRGRVEQTGPTQAASAPAAGSGEEVLAALERAGLRVLVHPWLGEPGVTRRGLLLGWVGIHGR